MYLMIDLMATPPRIKAPIYLKLIYCLFNNYIVIFMYIQINDKSICYRRNEIWKR